MTIALATILVGAILLYAGIKGKSVTALLRGNSQVDQPNTSLDLGFGQAPAATDSSSAGTGGTTGGSGSGSSGGPNPKDCYDVGGQLVCPPQAPVTPGGIG